MRVDAQFSLGRNLDIVQEATIIDGFATDLVGDYDKYLAAAQMADVLDKLLPEPHQAVEQQYLLLVRALKMLVSDLPAGISPNLVAVSYTLRALSIAGWEIDPYNLGNAGLTLPKQLPMEVFEMSIDALLQGDWQGCLTVIAEHPPLESELTRLVASFAVQHLERRLRSFTI
jgi:DNA repair protein RecO (recombination protein O)